MEPQVRYFSRRYRVITYNHRGYAPSSIPKTAAEYSQDILVSDLEKLIRHLDLGPVHLGGCSMGGNVARDIAVTHPQLLRSVTMVGAGAGAVDRENFLKGQQAIAQALDREGIQSRVQNFAGLSTRTSFKAKDPRGFDEFLNGSSEHDAQACAHLAREVMSKRKTVFELETQLRACKVPALIMVGDLDAPCVEPSLAMKTFMPHAGLMVFPYCGHTPNIEEPSMFNLAVDAFLSQVDAGRWAGWTR